MKRLLIVVAAVIGLLVVAVVAGAVWLRSDSGRSWLAAEIARQASTPGETEVSIGAIDGDPLGDFRITGIEVRDADGPWLTVRSAEVQWRPLDLLGGVLTLSRADIRDVVLSRLPEGDPDAPETSIEEQLDTLRGLPSIRISALTVDTLDIGAAVLGDAASLKIESSIDSIADSSVRTKLDVSRVDGRPGDVTLNVDYDLAGSRLTLDLTASEPEDGLLARALDVPGQPPFRASVKGDGALSDWKGRAEVAFGKVADGSADIVIRHRAETGFDITGVARLPQIETELLAKLFSGENRFRIAGAYSSDGIVTLSDATWNGSVAELVASGSLDTAGLTVDVNANAKTTAAEPLHLLPSDVRVGAVAVDLTATGKLTLPAVSATYTVNGLDVPDIAGADISGTATVKPESDESGRATMTAAIKALDWKDQPDLASLTGTAISLDIDAAIDLAKETVRVDKADVKAERATLSGTGDFGWSAGDGDAKAIIAVPDIAAFRDVSGLPLSGALVLTVDGTVKDNGATASLSVDGKATDFATGDALLDQIVSKDVSLTASASLANDVATVKSLSVLSGRVDLDGSATYGLGTEALDGRYALKIAGDEPVKVDDTVSVACACELSGTMSGKLADLATAGQLTVASVATGETEITTIEARYDITRLLDDLSATLGATAQSTHGPLKLDTKAELRDDRIALSDVKAEAGSATVTGALTVPLSGEPMDGDLRVEAKELKALLAIAGIDALGSAEGTVSLRADGPRQGLDAAMTTANLQMSVAPDTPVIEVRKGTLTLTADDLLAGDRNDGKLTLEGAAVGDVSIEKAAATVKGGLSKADVTLVLNGEWRGPFKADAKGTYAADDKGEALTLSALTGEFAGEAVSLAKPMELSWASGGYSAAPVDLTFGEARLSGHARLGQREIDVALELASLPMKIVDVFWPLGMEGDISATVALKGRPPEPEGKLTVSAPELRVDQAFGSPKLSVDMTGDWRKGRLDVDGKLAAGEAAPSTFQASLPLRLDGDDLGVEMRDSEPVSGKLAWSGETAALWRFAPIPEHLVRGDGEVDVTLSGTLAKPNLRGSLDLDNGYYESLEYGTVLKPLNVSIEFDGQQAKITKLSAKDGGTGSVDGSGQIDFDADSGFPFDLSLDLDKLTAVRRDDVTASASGTITMKGSMAEARVDSKLTTDQVEIRILDNLPPEVATLNVVEVGRVGAKKPEQSAEESEAANIDLDIEVEMPRRVFVRGRGIESEWRGNIKVEGPAAKPSISGYLAVVRGNVSVVGKTFQLESGNIVLPDYANAEPEMAMTAKYTGQSLTVTANVEGPISKPSITLTSVPELPQDEIVSNILFNKNSSRLTAGEAAQLALALAELTGKGGDGILDFARKTLGVDVLQIESVQTADGAKPVVGAGKYVTDDVYVGVKQGASPQTSSVGVQVDVTPNIVVESDMRRDGQSDVGVRFKLDY
ncbi:MAG: translocation/assembly module TamB domain-containing protein [Pseudomonadota bacterium]